jgi:integrase
MAVEKRTWTTKSGERTAWVVRYYDADGKYRTKTFKRERDAKDWDAQVKVDLNKGIHRPDSTSITVSEAARLWLERCAGDELEPETIRPYEIHLRLHINPAAVPDDTPNGWSGKLGDVKLAKLTTPMCVAFQRQLLTTNSRSNARRILVSFKAILKEAQIRGLILYNPAKPVRIDTKTREQAPIRIGEQVPSKADLRAILAASATVDYEYDDRVRKTARRRPQSRFERDRWSPLFFTAAFTGMRASELRGLTWPHVDLDGAVIHVRQRADRSGKIGPCKSVSSYREIQIPDALVDVLRRWKLVCLVNPLMLVFPNGAGNVESHSNIFKRGWSAVQHQIKMERPNGQAKYTFHSLRHFYASIMIEQGTPPKRLQALLGHKTLAVTMDTYGHLFPPGEDETKRLDQAVASVLAA